MFAACLVVKPHLTPLPSCVTTLLLRLEISRLFVLGR